MRNNDTQPPPASRYEGEVNPAFVLERMRATEFPRIARANYCSSLTLLLGCGRREGGRRVVVFNKGRLFRVGKFTGRGPWGIGEISEFRWNSLLSVSPFLFDIHVARFWLWNYNEKHYCVYRRKFVDNFKPCGKERICNNVDAFSLTVENCCVEKREKRGFSKSLLETYFFIILFIIICLLCYLLYLLFH